ncbi:uncharacterized protein LOC127847069 isoform X4 [Dreissena polymorpha]|nr:uncharacterized protein LOC127847069 isoform X4 [Dreissena polymorpha]
MMQNNDTAISGSITDVMDDVEVGSDIRVLADGYAATMNSVQIGANKDLVVGQAVWHVSQKTVRPNSEFQGNDYWWFTSWATDGTFAASRWQIGDHTSRGE